MVLSLNFLHLSEELDKEILFLHTSLVIAAETLAISIQQNSMINLLLLTGTKLKYFNMLMIQQQSSRILAQRKLFSGC